METQRNVAYKMEIILGVKSAPAGLAADNPAQFSAYNRSVSMIASQLEEAGLPKKQVSVGLREGEPDMVELVFRRYEPFNPLGRDTKSNSTKSGQAGDQEPL